MKNMTEHQRNEMLKEHEDAMKEMGKDVEFINQKLGRNNSGAAKMRQIHEILSSFTIDEILEVGTVMEELEEEEEKSQTNDS
jgi:hypothetical protein